MATVNGLTAERMLEIEAASVVDGTIDETGHLILTQHDGTEIDAGAVPSLPDASDIVKGVVELATPSEVIALSDETKVVTPKTLASVNNIPLSLSPGDFTQATDFSAYPAGLSNILYSAVNSTGWDFSGNSGEIRTFKQGVSSASQLWTKQVGGSSNYPEIWERTATTSGWTKWSVIAADTGWVDLQYASGYSALGTGETLQYRVKNGIVFFRGGASGTFATTIYETVTIANAIPEAYRPTETVRGGAVGTAMRPGGYQIVPAGSIDLGSTGLSSQPSWMAFTASYPLG